MRDRVGGDDGHVAKGEAALSAGVLIGSTIITVAIAGPILAIEAGHPSVHPAHIIVNLILVIALPLVAGLTIGAVRPLGERALRSALNIATLSVAALVALIAAEIHFSLPGYVAVGGSLVLFLAASVLLGRLIGSSSPRPTAASILLTTSMRDFAIAAGLAAAAFGAAAAAPLGLYGVLVLLCGELARYGCGGGSGSAGHGGPDAPF